MSTIRKRAWRKHYPKDLRVYSRTFLRRDGKLFEVTLCKRRKTEIVELWTPVQNGIWLRLVRMPVPQGLDSHDRRFAQRFMDCCDSH